MSGTSAICIRVHQIAYISGFSSEYQFGVEVVLSFFGKKGPGVVLVSYLKEFKVRIEKLCQSCSVLLKVLHK